MYLDNDGRMHSSHVTIYASEIEYGQQAQLAVAKSHLKPAVFQKIPYAAAHMMGGVSALVTSLGYRENGGNFPASTLLHLADVGRIPVAILSGHPYAKRLVRNNSSDIAIPPHPIEEIFPTLMEWLKGIRGDVDLDLLRESA